MNLSTSWIIASKDLREFLRKKSVLYTLVLLPFLFSVLFPGVIFYSGTRRSGGIPAAGLPTIMDAFAFFFVIVPAIIPTPIASYSIVGEKVEKSLEPLLAAPVTDGEILLGKSLAAFFPALAASLVGGGIFMVLMDQATYAKLGYLYYPNYEMAVILLVLGPLSAALSIEVNIIVSSRVNDVRAAGQLGGIMFLPFIGIYLAGEIGVFPLNTDNLLIIAGILAVVVAFLFRLSVATFRREEILTKWK